MIIAAGGKRSVVMHKCLWIVLLLFVFGTTPATAEKTALQTVEVQVERLLEILESGRTDEQILEAIRNEFIDFFDFASMSRLALGRHWRDISAEEREQFVQLYRELLENTYLDQVLEYRDEQVRFLDERELAENRAEVLTQVVRQNQLIPVNYRLIQQDGQWRIYDLVIENVSLSRNYRSQFASFLERNSFEDLLEELRRRSRAES
jgi:phospholipid transport system substrate-binding protein